MKNYIAPKSAVLSMNLSENIAASEAKSITALNMELWVVDGKIQEIEALDNHGTGKYLPIVLAWVASVTNAGLKYEELLDPCVIRTQG